MLVTTTTNLTTCRCCASCRVIESLRVCGAAAQVEAPRGFLRLRAATRVTTTHSPWRASLGMVRAMTTPTSITNPRPLRCTPCGFRNAISALRREVRIGHAARMSQSNAIIDIRSHDGTTICGCPGDDVRNPASTLITWCRCRETDSREAG